MRAAAVLLLTTSCAVAPVTPSRPELPTYRSGPVGFAAERVVVEGYVGPDAVRIARTTAETLAAAADAAPDAPIADVAVRFEKPIAFMATRVPVVITTTLPGGASITTTAILDESDADVRAAATGAQGAGLLVGAGTLALLAWTIGALTVTDTSGAARGEPIALLSGPLIAAFGLYFGAATALTAFLVVRPDQTAWSDAYRRALVAHARRVVESTGAPRPGRREALDD